MVLTQSSSLVHTARACLSQSGRRARSSLRSRHSHRCDRTVETRTNCGCIAHSHESSPRLSVPLGGHDRRTTRICQATPLLHRQYRRRLYGRIGCSLSSREDRRRSDRQPPCTLGRHQATHPNQRVHSEGAGTLPSQPCRCNVQPWPLPVPVIFRTPCKPASQALAGISHRRLGLCPAGTSWLSCLRI